MRNNLSMHNIEEVKISQVTYLPTAPDGKVFNLTIITFVDGEGVETEMKVYAPRSTEQIKITIGAK